MYSKAIEMFPDAAHFYLGRAKAHFYHGKLHLARDDLQMAVQKDPNNVEAVQRLQQLTVPDLQTAITKPVIRSGGSSGGGGSGGGGGGGGGRYPARSSSGGTMGSPIVRAGDRIVFASSNRSLKDNTSVKELPGRSRGPDDTMLVPQSFGGGIMVMPKADVRQATTKLNVFHTKRPLP